MPTITPTIYTVQGGTDIDGVQVTWANMHQNDVGAPIGSTINAPTALAPTGGGVEAGFVDRTFQVNAGIFDAATVTCEGSNDAGTTWSTLRDPFGTLISITAADIRQVTEASIWTRPHVNGGDGGTVLTVTMFLRKVRI